jgi:hypothetical protein
MVSSLTPPQSVLAVADDFDVEAALVELDVRDDGCAPDPEEL